MNYIVKSLAVLLVIASLTACGSKNKKIDNADSAPTTSEPAMAVYDPGINIDQVLEAALNGNISQIESALKKDFNVNTTDEEKHTALMMAAYNGHSTIVKLLLENGAEPDLRDQMDRTALMYSSTGPFNETVLLLLNAGASVNLVDNEEHFTALMFAAAEGQMEIVKTLLKHGADKTMLDVDKESAYDFALNNGHIEVAQLLK